LAPLQHLSGCFPTGRTGSKKTDRAVIYFVAVLERLLPAPNSAAQSYTSRSSASPVLEILELNSRFFDHKDVTCCNKDRQRIDEHGGLSPFCIRPPHNRNCDKCRFARQPAPFQHSRISRCTCSWKIRPIMFLWGDTWMFKPAGKTSLKPSLQSAVSDSTSAYCRSSVKRNQQSSSLLQNFRSNSMVLGGAMRLRGGGAVEIHEIKVGYLHMFAL
jgi:hypothetical protein